MAAKKPNATNQLSAGVRDLHISPVQGSHPLNVKSPATSASPQRLSILLIGSTGNGKSSLGNFLLDPSDEHISGKNTIFRTARSNLPETQHVQDNQCAYDRDVSLALQVIDTPGLNESDVKDLSHMIDLVKTLKHLESITACLFCIKFDSKIDDQYKYTAAYYRRLLPSLFEGNVIIVLTNFPTDQRSVRMRERQGVNVDAIVRNAQKEIVDGANLAFVPPVFLIDSLPMSEEERMASLSCRSSIVDYIRQSLRPIRIKELYVAKTRALKERDDKEIKQLDGEIHGYNMRLKEVNKKAERILDEIEQAQKEATEVRREIRNIEAELHEKDSEKTVIVKTWNLETSWKWFQCQTKSFDIRAEYPIVDVTRWDNGRLKWKEFQWSKDSGRAYGEVVGEWFRGLYATVTLLSEKRVKYKIDVKSCKKKLAEKKEEHARVKEFINRDRSLQEEHRQLEIELLNSYIEKRNKRKDNISADFMSIEEACKRVAELSTIK